ncbi:MAG: nucleotidyltransferase domain-containing protein, partial [Candidatus Freyarchaeota archaeon]
MKYRLRGTSLKAREGDVIETLDNIFFDVKGLTHPPGKIVAFPRFIPDPAGDRRLGGITYRKVYPLAERYALLRRSFPQYLTYDPVFDEYLCEVPIEVIRRCYRPINRLKALRHGKKLDALEKRALQLAEILKREAGIPWSHLGVSGSILIGLHRPTSDIDLIVYGSKSCRRVHSPLKNLLEEGFPLKPNDLEDLKRLFEFRSMNTA